LYECSFRSVNSLSTALQEHPRFQPVVTPAFVELIEVSAPLHDIGKVGVSHRILLKPGALTADERREMQRHPLVSSECLRMIEQRLGACNFLLMAREIALYHHERWDGQGYPQGLRGESIPLSARIADVYDALSSERVYKSAFPHAQCVEMIRAGAGTQFDPELVEVFLQIEDQFQEILLTWQDDLVAQAQPQATPPGPTTSSPSRSFRGEKGPDGRTCAAGREARLCLFLGRWF
jgi:cyclic di-GMP phosphodiesterase